MDAREHLPAGRRQHCEPRLAEPAHPAVHVDAAAEDGRRRRACRATSRAPRSRSSRASNFVRTTCAANVFHPCAVSTRTAFARPEELIDDPHVAHTAHVEDARRRAARGEHGRRPDVMRRDVVVRIGDRHEVRHLARVRPRVVHRRRPCRPRSRSRTRDDPVVPDEHLARGRADRKIRLRPLGTDAAVHLRPLNRGRDRSSCAGCSVASVYDRAATACASYVASCQPFGTSHGTTPRR